MLVVFSFRWALENAVSRIVTVVSRISVGSAVAGDDQSSVVTLPTRLQATS
jgi:hypothetical protein